MSEKSNMQKGSQEESISDVTEMYVQDTYSNMLIAVIFIVIFIFGAIQHWLTLFD